MIAEVISIGDELTSGQRLDTNSQWLSIRLGELGVTVAFHSTVRDNLANNVEAFRIAAGRADLVVVTGGLGPTADDLTREALAQLIGKPLVRDEQALAYIRALFARRARPMPERNEVQAMFPEGSRVIPNPAGTAPGIDLDVPRPSGAAARVFALPGVPAEMREMWEQTVAPAISSMLPVKQVVCHRQIKCFGAGESDLEQMLPDIIRRGREPQVGITVSGATITLRITSVGPTREACNAQMQDTVDVIHQSLKSLVFGEGDDELEHAVVRLLKAKGQTVAASEWASGGLVAHWLSDVPDSEQQYLGGFVVRSAVAASELAGVEFTDAMRDEHSLKELVSGLARAARREMKSDFGLAVGPLPHAAPDEKTPPRLYLALASSETTESASFPFAGHPDILRPRGAKQALNLLRLRLLKQA